MRYQKLGRLDITNTLLKQLLSLPEECEIKYVHRDTERADILTLIIKSDHCPESPEGAVIPRITMQQLSGFDE